MSLTDDLISGPNDEPGFEQNTPVFGVGAGLGPQSPLSFDAPATVGSVVAPSARYAPVAMPAPGLLYPQYTPHRSIVDQLVEPKPGPTSWRDILFRSLVAGLGNVAARRAGLDPLTIQGAAGERQQELDVEDYKARLTSAQMLRQQLNDEATRREKQRLEEEHRATLASQIYDKLNNAASTGEIERYKQFVRDFIPWFPVDRLPSLPSVGALMKVRKGYQDTLTTTLAGLKTQGIDVTDASLFDENNPKAPTVDVLGPDGPVHWKLGTLAKHAIGADYDPTQLPRALPEFGGKERARADAKARALYGPTANYTALKDEDWKDLAHEIAVAQHITIAQPGMGSDDLDTNAQAVVDGRAVPSLYSKNKGYMNALMARANKLSLEQTGKPLNYLKLESDWLAAKKWAQSQNSERSMTFQSLGTSVLNTMDDVQKLGDMLQQGGVQKWNAAKLSTVRQVFGNTPQSELATQYVNAVNTLKEEFAQLASGGYAPTEPAWKLADEQINKDVGVKDLHAAMTELKRLISFRLNARYDVRPVGPYGERPSFLQQYDNEPPPGPPPPATGAGTGSAGAFHFTPQDVGKTMTLQRGPQKGQRVVITYVSPDGLSYRSRPARPGE